jgi:hypothetical protein
LSALPLLSALAPPSVSELSIGFNARPNKDIMEVKNKISIIPAKSIIGIHDLFETINESSCDLSPLL